MMNNMTIDKGRPKTREVRISSEHMVPATIDIKQAPIKLKKPFRNQSSNDAGTQLRLRQQNVTTDSNSNRNYYREYADQELTCQHFMRSSTTSDRNEARKLQLNIDISKDVTTQMRDTVAEEDSLQDTPT